MKEINTHYNNNNKTYGMLHMKLLNICNQWTGKHYTDQRGRKHSVTDAVTCH